MGDPWPKKNAGIFSGVAGRLARAAFHSSSVLGTARFDMLLSVPTPEVLRLLEPRLKKLGVRKGNRARTKEQARMARARAIERYIYATVDYCEK